MYIIGIDLATKSTGITLLKDNQHIKTFKVKTLGYSEKNFLEVYKCIQTIIYKKLDLLFIDKLELNEKILIVIESVRANMYVRFDFYKGIYVSTLLHLFLMKGYKDIEFKEITPITWKKYLGLQTQFSKREKKLQKQQAKDYCVKQLGDIVIKEKWNDDMCDSYCIAIAGNNVNSVEENRRLKK